MKKILVLLTGLLVIAAISSLGCGSSSSSVTTTSTTSITGTTNSLGFITISRSSTNVFTFNAPVANVLIMASDGSSTNWYIYSITTPISTTSSITLGTMPSGFTVYTPYTTLTPGVSYMMNVSDLGASGGTAKLGTLTFTY